MLQMMEAENIKKVLFGNQRQADAINDAVVNFIGNFIADNNVGSVATEDAVIDTISEYLSRCIDRPEIANELVIRFITGDMGYANLKSGAPLSLSVKQPNIESPKLLFRIVVFGDDPVVPIKTPAPTFTGEVVDDSAASVTADKKVEGTETFAERAERIKKEILPIVPDAVRREVTDEYAQALCCAEYYYRSVGAN